MAIKQEVHFGLPHYFLSCTVSDLSFSVFFRAFYLEPLVKASPCFEKKVFYLLPLFVTCRERIPSRRVKVDLGFNCVR